MDEPIYRRLPCFLVATVDKFASLPWTGETGALFGRIERYDENGFYGPCAQTGDPFDGRLPPPDLIIQDELHLISGPLGTIAGLYQTAIDELAAWQIGDLRVRPKIIASMATVRRAGRQIRALFGRAVAVSDHGHRHGVLIYTGSPDAEGTLGGLVQAGREIDATGHQSCPVLAVGPGDKVKGKSGCLVGASRDRKADRTPASPATLAAAPVRAAAQRRRPC